MANAHERGDTGLSIVEPTTAVPEAAARRKIGMAEWNTLIHSLYPGAKPESVILVIDYCRARGLDVMKRPAHIVPMEVKDRSGNYAWRDVVLPGIYELRITANRTGEYLGHTAPTYGPEMEYRGVSAPEWVEMVMLRFSNKTPDQPIQFPVRVWFREAVTLSREGRPNARWSKAPRQMLTKVCEAAGLREAFPDEIGGEHTIEEMDGATVDAGGEAAAIDAPPLPPKPDGFDEWLIDLIACADEGTEPLRAAYKNSPKPRRAYLEATDPARIETLRARAQSVDRDRTVPPVPPADGAA